MYISPIRKEVVAKTSMTTGVPRPENHLYNLKEEVLWHLGIVRKRCSVRFC